jgi:hypothetical protein
MCLEINVATTDPEPDIFLIYRPKLYLNTSAVLDAELVVTKQK